MQSRLIRSLAAVAVGASLLMAAGCNRTNSPSAGPDLGNETYDLWIRNGTVVDGTGKERYVGDVLVRGDTIAFVGALKGATVSAKQTIDAEGKIVAPGFIDTHGHGDPTTRPLMNFLAQGVTTVVLGQDGVTAAFAEHKTPDLETWRSATSESKPAVTLSQWMRSVDDHGSEVNIAALSGHATLRRIAGVGDAPVPTSEQISIMQEILRADLEAGAFGLSFGLEYYPGRHADTTEQKAVGDLVGRYGGVVMSHMRSEDTDKIAAAIDELLAIDANAHVSHVKIVAGQRKEEAHAVLDQLARARQSGRRVTADVYPYTASAANLVFLYPDWAKQREQYEKAVVERRDELERHIRSRVAERLGPEAILFTSGPHAGKRLSDLAAAMNKPFEKVVIDELGYGGPQSAHFVMTPQVHDEFVRAENVSICTDGAPRLLHPRSAGSFARVLQEHVGDAPRMSLERAIHKMSGLAATIVGLDDRGILAKGMKADIVVLTLEKVHDNATWNEPLLPPDGFDAVVVNGVVAVQDGELKSRPGRMLRRQYPASVSNVK